MSTWPEAAREVTPEESDAARVWRRDDRIAYADPEPVTYAEHYAGEHFRKTYGLWLETGE